MVNKKFDYSEVLNFLQSHTYRETSIHFGISEMQISRIKKKVGNDTKVSLPVTNLTKTIISDSDKDVFFKISDILMNEFLQWINTINPDQYPLQSQLIRQVQLYKKKSIIANIFQLFGLFQQTKLEASQ